MKSLGELFVKIKKAAKTIDGQEYVEVEYKMKSEAGEYKVKVIMEKQAAFRLVETSSAEQALHPQLQLLAKG